MMDVSLSHVAVAGEIDVLGSERRNGGNPFSISHVLDRRDGGHCMVYPYAREASGRVAPGEETKKQRKQDVRRSVS